LIEFGHSLGNLSIPGLGNILVRDGIDAIHQPGGKFGPVVFRKLQGRLK
jgi:hypothetical protein